MRFIIFAISILSFASFNLDAKIMTTSDVHVLAKSILKEGNGELTNLNILDIGDFCPSYPSLSADEKEEFFAHLITEISYFESGYNTDDVFKENNGNISAGLLQISYPSLSTTYKKNGCNEITSTNDLKNPSKNIKCGFGIILTLVKRFGYISNKSIGGASSYWSTLRTPYDVYVKVLKRTVRVGKKDIIQAHIKNNYSRCFN